ncbi:helix-turn-helix domain-containing protein [Acinetobacter bereziniae]|uniref:helix-turn-helix domain-containing protein n=1 Tax=Acinetobacter bereziniae TaxID=106648 RepID=UPI00124FB0EA|nr:helix-turn-helix transcriptional regulator [Acinetobacter bereziniae]
MRKNHSFNEVELFKVIGHNCKVVRETNGLTRQVVLEKVWNYSNNQKFANRVSELENGSKKIDIATLYKFCIEMGCSADFLLGLSAEIEVDNLEAKTAGRIFQSLRSAVLDATNDLCVNVSKAIRYLPPYQGELLKSSSRNVVDIINVLKNDLAFRGTYGELIDAVQELSNQVIAFERYTSRQLRQVELSMINLLEDDEDENTGHQLNRTFVGNRSENMGDDH